MFFESNLVVLGIFKEHILPNEKAEKIVEITKAIIEVILLVKDV